MSDDEAFLTVFKGTDGTVWATLDSLQALLLQWGAAYAQAATELNKQDHCRAEFLTGAAWAVRYLARFAQAGPDMLDEAPTYVPEDWT